MGPRVIILVLALLAWALTACQASAGEIPPGAHEHAPTLVEVQGEVWPHAPAPYTLAGLVEQESCISLTHSKCWNPRSELRTSREYGFGFGQITVAYRADGSVRFNKFEELRAQHRSLRDWAWSDRYDPKRQLTAIVEMSLDLWRRIAQAGPGATVDDHWGFVLSAYNGGLGGVLQDRRLCDNTRGCDPARWFGHVADHSTKSRRPQPGYGNRSWFDINRGHVRNVLMVRRDKYMVFWRST